MLILSGYGGNKAPTLKMYDDLKQKPVFSRYEKNCSYLCSYNNIIFGITEDEPKSAIYLYKLNDDCVELYDTRPIEGGLLCHISYIKKSRLLVGACYGTGNIFSVKVDIKNKCFCSEITYYTQGQIEGKAHCVCANENETILYSANIMQDRIYRYSIKQNGLELIDYLQLPLGIGPRHILSINNDCYYVITEYSNEILLVKHNVLSEMYSTVGYDFCGKSYGSTLCMTKNKKYLYAANRGENTISVFSVNSDFSLINIGRFDCGNFPRHISLYDDDKYIISANQKGDSVDIFELDKNNGMNKSKTAYISFKSPSFVMEK